MFLEHRNEMQRLAQQQERQRENLRASIEANREYADTLILSQEETKNLTLAEAEAYAERLAAPAGSTAIREPPPRDRSREQLRSRGPERRRSRRGAGGGTARARGARGAGGPAGPAGRAARVFDLCRTDRHRGRPDQGRGDRHHPPRTGGAAERVRAARRRDLEQIQQERVAIEEEFASLVDRIRSRGAAGPEEELDFIDIAGIQARARQALAAGDFERAIELAREAGKGLEELQEAGETNTLALAGTAQNIRRIAEEAARAREEAAQANVEQIAGTIEELTARAEFLRRIEIGFDEESAAQSAEQSARAQVQAAAGTESDRDPGAVRRGAGPVGRRRAAGTGPGPCRRRLDPRRRRADLGQHPGAAVERRVRAAPARGHEPDARVRRRLPQLPEPHRPRTRLCRRRPGKRGRTAAGGAAAGF
ncbi:MAG: hypothetical protein U5P41_07130 [Gammaproteobacteria bacterium]|nr:hypothetical protein [Gammaproteobacteria bacterium]